MGKKNKRKLVEFDDKESEQRERGDAFRMWTSFHVHFDRAASESTGRQSVFDSIYGAKVAHAVGSIVRFAHIGSFFAQPLSLSLSLLGTAFVDVSQVSIVATTRIAFVSSLTRSHACIDAKVRRRQSHRSKPTIRPSLASRVSRPTRSRSRWARSRLNRARSRRAVVVAPAVPTFGD